MIADKAGVYAAAVACGLQFDLPQHQQPHYFHGEIMSRNFQSPAELHADHRRWDSEISMWKDDIVQWKIQHQTALAQLEEIARLIYQHATIMDEHLGAIEQFASGIEFHEKHLSGSLHSGREPGFDNELAERHTDIADELALQRISHERNKQYHHVAMAQVASLLASLKAAR